MSPLSWQRVEPTNSSEPGSAEALMKNQVIINHNMTEQRRIVAEQDASQAQVDALKRLQAESRRGLHAPLAVLLPAILDRAFKGEL